MPSDLPAVFGHRFREARRNAKLSQQDIERLSGIPQSYISNIERGLENPTLETVTRLAAAVGKSLSDLFQA